MKAALFNHYLDGSGGTATFPTCVFFDSDGVQQDSPTGAESMTLLATTTRQNIIDIILTAARVINPSLQLADIEQWRGNNNIVGMRSAAITGNPCDVYYGAEQVTTPAFTLPVSGRAFFGQLPDEAYPGIVQGAAGSPPNLTNYTTIPINLAAGANQSLVSAPGAGKQIWVYGLGFSVNVAGTVSFQDEDDTAISGIMQIGATGGFAFPPSGNFAMPLWILATNKALEVDVVTSELDGFLCYGIVSV